MRYFRPRRSMLYSPAYNAHFLDKAQTLAADSIIMDLEETVIPEAKQTARDNAVPAQRKRNAGRRRDHLARGGGRRGKADHGHDRDPVRRVARRRNRRRVRT